MPKTNKERLQDNNAALLRIKAKAQSLPDADEINDKIDEQDIIINNLKSTLDQKASGGNGATLNIFTGLTEPITKKGIWLETSQTAEHYISTYNVAVENTWAKTNAVSSVPYIFSYGSAVAIGTDIYLLGSDTTPFQKNNYKYDTLTDTYIQMTNIPFNFNFGSAVLVGTDIYLLYNTNNYKYDTLTDTYTQMTNIPYPFVMGSAVAVGTDIYILGSSNSTTAYRKNNYKYDTLTDTYTKMANIPYEFQYGSAVVVGTDIYLLGSSTMNRQTYNYKYNTLTDTYTQMSNLPYSFSSGSAVAIGTDIYLLGSAQSNQYTKFYKYDTLTDTYTQMTNIPYDYYNGSAVTISNSIYIFGGASPNYNKASLYYLYSTNISTDNTIVLLKGKLYDVELLTTSLFEENYQPLYSFKDVYFYTIQDGLDDTIPTYYGDGTQWINFKNPPSNNNE